MTIKVLYFGELREQINLSAETVKLLDASITVQTLVNHLIQRGHPWSNALKASDPLRVAINQEMAQLNTQIPENAEVALFRPVTGG